MIGITIAPELLVMILNCGFGMYHMSSGRSRPKQWSIPTAETKAKRSLLAVGYTAKVSRTVRAVIDTQLVQPQN